MKGYKHSKETKEKMSKSHKGENAVWFGKKQPKEMIQKRVKMAKEKNGRKVKIFGVVYDSMVYAENELGISSKNIWYRIQSKNYAEYQYL
jgi:ribosomal protein L10